MKSSSYIDLQRFMLIPTKFPLSPVFVCASVRLFSGVQFVRQCLKSMCKEKGNIFSNSSLFCMFFFYRL